MESDSQFSWKFFKKLFRKFLRDYLKKAAFVNVEYVIIF